MTIVYYKDENGGFGFTQSLSDENIDVSPLTPIEEAEFIELKQEADKERQNSARDQVDALAKKRVKAIKKYPELEGLI